MADDTLLPPGSLPDGTYSTMSQRNNRHHNNVISGSKDNNRKPSAGTKKPLQKVCLNVSGHRFVTHAKTLKRMPGTRLGDLKDSDDTYDPEEGEHFFDRNPIVFHGVLDLYRTGELHFPHNICARVVKNELAYWRIDDQLLSECCWQAYSQSEATVQNIQTLCGAFCNMNGIPYETAESAWKHWKKAIWNFFEFPRSSTAATVWAFVYALIVTISIFITVFETLDVFRLPDSERFDAYMNITQNSKEVQIFSTRLNPAMISLELVTGTTLTIELLLRFIFCPSKFKFIQSPMAWLELVSLAMMWLVVGYYTILPVENTTDIMIFSGCLCLRNLRVLRVFRIARHFPGWTILLLSLKGSIWEILVLLSFMLTGVLVFAVLIFSAQFWTQDGFTGVPIGFWWAIVTMTTVGYGDFYPTTLAGYIVGALCALTGMLATGLPIPIIANNFNTLNTFYKLWKCHESDEDTLLWGRRVTGTRKNPKAITGVTHIKETKDAERERTLQRTDDLVLECNSSTDLTIQEI